MGMSKGGSIHVWAHRDRDPGPYGLQTNMCTGSMRKRLSVKNTEKFIITYIVTLNNFYNRRQSAIPHANRDIACAVRNEKNMPFGLKNLKKNAYLCNFPR